MIRIGTGTTNSSVSTSERLYLNCTQTDGIVLKSAIGSNSDIAMVFNDSSRLGNSNRTFYLTESNQGYAYFSCNNTMLYGTTVISRSNITAFGNINVSGSIVTGTTLLANALISATDLTAPSNVYTNTVHTKYIAQNSRTFITFDQSSSVTTTIDSDVSVSGSLILSKPLALQNAVIDNVVFNSNVTLPSLSLVPKPNFDTLGVYYNSGVNLGGCNLLNIQINGTSAMLVNSVGYLGINTSNPSAPLDIVAASNASNVLNIRDSTLSSNISVDNQCRLGLGTSKPAYKLHIFDCNITNPTPSPVIGINVNSSPLKQCAPLLAAFSNNIPVLQIANTGGIILGSNTYNSNYMLNVAGSTLTNSLITSNIGSVGNSPINFQTSVLSNIQSLNSCNLNIISGTATTFFANSFSTSNLNIPNVTINNSSTIFNNSNTLFTGTNVTFGPSTDNTNLSLNPSDTCTVLVSVPSYGGTVVALGVIGNSVGRNVIRIAANYPAFELYSGANTNYYQKCVQGIHQYGYYMSYDNTNSLNLTATIPSIRQFQITQYGVRICQSLQISQAAGSNGYVGICLPTPSDLQPTLPSYPLHINGAVWVQSSTDATTTTTAPCFFVNDSNCRVGIRTNNPQTDLHVNGSVFVNSIETVSPVSTSSDRRLKTNITPITHALSKVQQLTGYTFTRKTNAKRETGLLAQEVLAVLPEAVTTSSITNPLDPSYLMGVAYGNMAGLFVEAIKEMSQRIDALQTEVNALKFKNINSVDK